MTQNMEHGKKSVAARILLFILALVFMFSIFSGMISAGEIKEENSSFTSSEEIVASIPPGIVSATGNSRTSVSTWKSMSVAMPGWLKTILKILPIPKTRLDRMCKSDPVNMGYEPKWECNPYYCEHMKQWSFKCGWVQRKIIEYGSFCHTTIDPPEISVEISSKIFPLGSAAHLVPVDPTTSSAISYITWDEGDLDLVLYSPNGTMINPSAAANDTNISYGKGMVDKLYMAIYAIQNPEPGNWFMEITAIDVPSDGGDYYAIAYLISNLTLTLSTDKDKYNQSEPPNIRADLRYNGTPLIGAFVTVEVQRPDSTVENIPLFDDGSHGDI